MILVCVLSCCASLFAFSVTIWSVSELLPAFLGKQQVDVIFRVLYRRHLQWPFGHSRVEPSVDDCSAAADVTVVGWISILPTYLVRHILAVYQMRMEVS